MGGVHSFPPESASLSKLRLATARSFVSDEANRLVFHYQVDDWTSPHRRTRPIAYPGLPILVFLAAVRIEAAQKSPPDAAGDAVKDSGLDLQNDRSLIVKRDFSVNYGCPRNPLRVGERFDNASSRARHPELVSSLSPADSGMLMRMARSFNSRRSSAQRTSSSSQRGSSGSSSRAPQNGRFQRHAQAEMWVF